jgi:hypothetical protein
VLEGEKGGEGESNYVRRALVNTDMVLLFPFPFAKIGTGESTRFKAQRTICELYLGGLCALFLRLHLVTKNTPVCDGRLSESPLCVRARALRTLCHGGPLILSAHAFETPKGKKKKKKNSTTPLSFCYTLERRMQAEEATLRQIFLGFGYFFSRLHGYPKIGIPF